MSKVEIVPGDTFYNMLLNNKLEDKKITIEKGEFKEFIVFIDKNKRAYIHIFGKEKDLNTCDLLNSTFRIKEQKNVDIQEIQSLNPNDNYFKDGTELVHKLMYGKINELVMAVKQLDKKIKEK